jgi:hypothetical protein
MVSTLLEIYERLINSTAEEVFQTQSQLHAPARPRQILILNFNYVYSQN